jgi:hypothetical protein
LYGVVWCTLLVYSVSFYEYLMDFSTILLGEEKKKYTQKNANGKKNYLISVGERNQMKNDSVWTLKLYVNEGNIFLFTTNHLMRKKGFNIRILKSRK